MPEITSENLSPKSQKSSFAQIIVAEADALLKKNPDTTVKALERHARDRVAYGQYSERLRKEADIDATTGLLSRRAILREIREAMAQAERRGETIQIVFTDVRNFKEINDQFGHRTGDFALKLTGTGLRNSIREYDAAGRYGGDEDIVLLRDGDKRVPDFLRERLLTSLQKENQPYNSLQIDMGVVDYNPIADGRLSVDELVHRADQAMYFGKINKLQSVKRWDSSLRSLEVKK